MKYFAGMFLLFAFVGVLSVTGSIFAMERNGTGGVNPDDVAVGGNPDDIAVVGVGAEVGRRVNPGGVIEEENPDDNAVGAGAEVDNGVNPDDIDVPDDAAMDAGAEVDGINLEVAVADVDARAGG